MNEKLDIAKKLVSQAVEVTNEILEDDKKLEDSPEFKITGEGGSLDSMGIVGFVLAVEDALRDQTNSSVTLFDEALIADPSGPFENMCKLTNHISVILSK